MGWLLVVWLFCSGAAQAGPLGDRIADFPNWPGKPPVQAAIGDLDYPDWMAGEWTVTTTLEDLTAPLAPELETPGFESNRQYLGQPISFQVRFGPAPPQITQGTLGLIPLISSSIEPKIVADRAFNGKNLAKAYLGDDAVLDVKVDPDSSNRQITLLRGGRQLVSSVTGRATERPDGDRFLTTEVFQQVFRGGPQLYFNEVETTTAYQRLKSEKPAIAADQITAIYLSPQDPDYFKALNRPVALYRYRLEFFRP